MSPNSPSIGNLQAEIATELKNSRRGRRLEQVSARNQNSATTDFTSELRIGN
jgi:hypothetical protein